MSESLLEKELKPYYFEKRKILLVGATGLIGSALYEKFKNEGHTIKILSTNKDFVSNNSNAFYWNVEEEVIDDAAFEGVEVIVNLAGANIAEGLWTKKRKKILYDSRVKGTKLLASTCQKLNKSLKFYIGASATGYYGPNNTHEAKVESDPKGEGFLADLCADWESAHHLFDEISDVLVIARLSNVFSHTGGFLFPFLKLSDFGLRICFGKKESLVSWIHIEDVVRFISAVLYMDIVGTFNIAVSYNKWPELQNYLYDRFGDQIIRFRIPNFVLKLMLGDMSTLLLDGNYVSGNRLEEFGFMVKHIELNLTVKEIMQNLPKKL